MSEAAPPAGLTLVIQPRARDIGGFSVRRSLPSPRRRLVGPFIFFDHMGPVDFAPGQGIDVRPHPSDSIPYYRWLLDTNEFENVALRAGNGFQETATQYDLVIGSYSTTVLEAALMGIPVLFYHPSKQRLYEPFDGSCEALPSAFQKYELAETIDLIMKDRSYAYGFTAMDVLKPYVGDGKGRADSRIFAELILAAKTVLSKTE